MQFLKKIYTSPLIANIKTEADMKYFVHKNELF